MAEGLSTLARSWARIYRKKKGSNVRNAPGIFSPRIERALVRANRCCIAAMLGVMFILVFTNVVTRYCLGFSIATAEEISTFLMIWVTYLGAGLALREGRLASIDALQDRLPPWCQRPVRFFLWIVLFGFFAIFLVYSIGFVSLGWSQLTFALMIPRGIPYLVLPVGAALFVLHLIFFFRRWMRKEWEATSPLDVEERSEVIKR